MMEAQEKNGPQIVGSFLCIGLQSYLYGESAFVEVKVRISLLWWSVGGSNPWPQDCEPCALPAELTPRATVI